jgi:DNA-binding NarL/FixJ family response regulator
LTSIPGWEVCAEAANGKEAVDKAEEHRPDIVVMDVCMPELNGMEATRKIRKNLPQTQVVILSHHFSDQLVREVVDSGAHAYVLKSDADRDLFIAVEALANGRAFFTPTVAPVLVDRFLDHRSATKPSSRGGTLTAREREIIQLLTEGNSNKEVACRLGIGVKTAQAHRAHIYRKLKIHSVSELVRYAVKNYIIEP